MFCMVNLTVHIVVIDATPLDCWIRKYTLVTVKYIGNAGFLRDKTMFMSHFMSGTVWNNLGPEALVVQWKLMMLQRVQYRKQHFMLFYLVFSQTRHQYHCHALFVMNPTVLPIAWLVRLIYDNESVLEMMRFVSCLFLYKILICSKWLRTLRFELFCLCKKSFIK